MPCLIPVLSVEWLHVLQLALQFAGYRASVWDGSNYYMRDS